MATETPEADGLFAPACGPLTTAVYRTTGQDAVMKRCSGRSVRFGLFVDTDATQPHDVHGVARIVLAGPR